MHDAMAKAHSLDFLRHNVSRALYKPGVAGVIGCFFTVVEVAKIILCGHGSSSFLSPLKSIRVYGLIS